MLRPPWLPPSLLPEQEWPRYTTTDGFHEVDGETVMPMQDARSQAQAVLSLESAGLLAHLMWQSGQAAGGHMTSCRACEALRWARSVLE